MGRQPNLREGYDDPTHRAYRKRRNNVLPGLMVCAGGGGIAAAAFLPWITLSGPSITIGFKDIVDVGLNPEWSGGSSSVDGTRPLMLACAALAVIAGMLLMITRRPGLGVFWRLFGWVALAAPAFLLVVMWQTATSSASDLVDDSSSGKGVAVVLDRVARSMNLYNVGPANGLYVWTGGVVLLTLGLFVPAGRSVEPSL